MFNEDLRAGLKAYGVKLIRDNGAWRIYIKNVPGFHITNTLKDALAYAQIDHCYDCGYYRKGPGCVCFFAGAA